jgi:hypothetical protein
MKKLIFLLLFVISLSGFSQSKITIASVDATSFSIDGRIYQKNLYEIYNDDVVFSSGTIFQRIGIRHYLTKEFPVYPIRWDRWTTDGTTSQVSFDATVTMINGIIGAFGTGGTGGGTTNLTYDPSTNTIESDTGTDATITNASGTVNGLMSITNFNKLGTTIVEHPETAVSNARLFIGTQAQKDAATITGSDVSIVTDAAPAEIATGTALDLSGYKQYNTTPSAATTYTTTNFKTGGYVEAFINTTSEPTITGATKFTGTANWVTGVDMLMCVKGIGTSTVKYFFVRL